MKRSLIFLSFLICSFSSIAEEQYYEIPVSSLKIVEGAFPEPSSSYQRIPWQRREFLLPYASLNVPGSEAYVRAPQSNLRHLDHADLTALRLCIASTSTLPLQGDLYLPKANLSGMVLLRFEVPAGTRSGESDKANFFEARNQYYQSLLARNISGSAWFRYQLQNTNSAAALPALQVREEELTRTYDLFTGGRAISENLQLDRQLQVTDSIQPTNSISSIEGISISPFDWKARVKDLNPPLDTLASCIPEDQHAIFFNSFEAMSQTLEKAEEQGAPVTGLMQSRVEDSKTKEKYQKQLCLDLSDVSRLLGPHLIKSMAFTGGDVFLPTGSDVAVLFETTSPEVLATYLKSKHLNALASDESAKDVSGKLDDVNFQGIRNRLRTVSSYTAILDDRVVVVTNSDAQLKRIISTLKKQTPALISSEEYRFFRDRYPLKDPHESAFGILTDATIRRWCGPQWRIADSRRIRAAALLSDLTAKYLNEIKAGKSFIPEESKLLEFDLGKLEVTPQGIVSSIYGTLEFFTPISELNIQFVSDAEKTAYERWRNTYQSNWRQFFDPIALRLSVKENQLAADITVMPLITGTSYSSMIGMSQGAKLKPNAGDPHPGTLFHHVMAFNPESHQVQRSGSFLSQMSSDLSNPFGWMGTSIAIYADQDSFWKDLLNSDDASKFYENELYRLPIGLQFEVRNPLKLAAFLTGIRGFVAQSAPNMTLWETLTHRDMTYVKISPAPSALGHMGENTNTFSKLALYYAPTPDALLVTLSETVLTNALNRKIALTNSLSASSTSTKAWLGETYALTANEPVLDVVQKSLERFENNLLQLQSWNHLPILNEWHKLFPAEDPIELHQKIWGVRLTCPSGGSYVWNEKWHTMESTVYGHPGEPRSGPYYPKAAEQISHADFGLTFENDGVRAVAKLQFRETR